VGVAGLEWGEGSGARSPAGGAGSQGRWAHSPGGRRTSNGVWGPRAPGAAQPRPPRAHLSGPRDRSASPGWPPPSSAPSSPVSPTPPRGPTDLRPRRPGARAPQPGAPSALTARSGARTRRRRRRRAVGAPSPAPPRPRPRPTWRAAGALLPPRVVLRPRLAPIARMEKLRPLRGALPQACSESARTWGF
jgi:hypothetical protein